MKMKPIIFSTPMVQAILDGRKTMTRRVIKPQPTYWDAGERLYDKDNIVGPEFYTPIRVDKDGEQYPGEEVYGIYSDNGEYGCKAPYKPGDILWVRETWQSFFPEQVTPQHQQGPRSRAGVPAKSAKGHYMHYYYRADGEIEDAPEYGKTHFPEYGKTHFCKANWMSPIYMPREAARIFLRVTYVWVEQVQDISEEDAKAEGVTAINDSGCGYRGAFRELWNALNAKRGFDWYTNSWVWVIRFERLDTLALAARAGAEPVYQQLLRSAT